MPLLTTTIEDNSPLITYTSNWQAGSSSSDTLLDQFVHLFSIRSFSVLAFSRFFSFPVRYSASAFTLTFTSGATATFTFNGTAITLYGAKRGNHGTYQVSFFFGYTPALSIFDPIVL